jgi:hypothetical protein
MDDVRPAAHWLTYAVPGNGRDLIPRSDTQVLVREAIRDAVTQLEYAEQRVEDERALARRTRNRAEEVERLQAAVIARLTAEQEELRRHLNAAISAERTAREEATGFKAELDALKTRGFWARLRSKTP